MAVSKYDQQYLTKSQQDGIRAVTEQAQNGVISWADAHAAAENLRSGAGYSGGQYGDGYYRTEDDSGGYGNRGSGGNGAYTDDVSAYMKKLYAENTASDLAALRKAYRENLLDLEASAENIPETFAAQKNQPAAQNALARQSFNEFAATRGLNSGASGQAELARSAALQGDLAAIGAQEAAARSENALAQNKLTAAYEAAIQQARSSGNSALAGALYQEFVRQTENAQTQANLDRQFDYGKAGDTRDYAYSTAMTMIQAGVMPDDALLTSAGISRANAQALRAAALR